MNAEWRWRHFILFYHNLYVEFAHDVLDSFRKNNNENVDNDFCGARGVW